MKFGIYPGIISSLALYFQICDDMLNNNMDGGKVNCLVFLDDNQVKDSVFQEINKNSIVVISSIGNNNA